MTRVTISGDGSYQVSVKVSRRSSGNKRAKVTGSAQPLTIRETSLTPSRHTHKHKEVEEQLRMNL
ncbi:MAG: hypothetical protein M3R61_06780 [Chloroflexota bacterium]|nr:hypothetical protein [Chloroflexota bacterium]